MDDYCIRFVVLPLCTRGVTVQDANGFYNVYINSNLSADTQKEAILHELQHIKRGDFSSIVTLAEAEAQ